jgi:hypothetical protein
MAQYNTEFRKVATFTIVNGATVSDIINMQDYYLCGLDIPAMTGTALTLEGSIDGVTFRSLKDTTLGTNYSTLTVDGTGAIMVLTPATYTSCNYWRLTAGSAQGAERLIDALGYRG